MSNGRSRSWIIVINNYTEDEYNKLVEYIQGSEYGIVGKETGESGTDHLQAYTRFKNAKSFSSVKKSFPRAHVEVAKGSDADNKQYCSKDGDFVEHGVVSMPGRRTDLEAVRESIRNGSSLLEIADKDFGTFCHNYRAFMVYSTLYHSALPRKVPVVTYIWGQTGSGKTREVYEREQSSLFVYPGKGWFDGYENQEAALFDDFRADDGISIGFLLRLLDRYPLRVPIKGGFVSWRPKRIYITSNRNIEELFPLLDKPSQEALERRIHEIKFL